MGQNKEKPTFDISVSSVTEDFALFTGIWNVGIDARLEAFVLSYVVDDTNRRTFKFNYKELHILLLRIEDLLLSMQSKGEDYTSVEDWFTCILDSLEQSKIKVKKYERKWY